MTTKLEGAVERLAQALERFEGALRQPGKSVAAAIAPNQREIQALQSDRARLAEELDHVKANYATLQSLTDEVEGRLDSAIANVRRIMRG